MVRNRLYGEDKPFLDWVRRNDQELPSAGDDCGFVVSDVDVMVHRYKVVNRSTQKLMFLEVKSRGAFPTVSQSDTLRKFNEFKGTRLINGNRVTYCGVFFLQMSGTTPDDSEWMKWGRYAGGRIEWHDINTGQLFQLLRFEMPQELKDRHHG